jgi:hypothetical protein
VQKPNSFAAVDVGVLLALEAGDEEAEESIDLLRKRAFYFLVTETPLQELADICKSTDPEIAAHAKNAIIQITNWGFLTPPLSPTQMGIAERNAGLLIENCLTDGCLNDGLCIIEASLNNCKILITKRQMICDVSKHEPLNLALMSFDLPLLVVASPKLVIEALS